jgi:hypothetical protein
MWDLGPTRTLFPIEDAYVRAGRWAGSNLGAIPTLGAKKGISADNTRRSYLKFDISPFTGSERATLRLYGQLSDVRSRHVATTVYAVLDTAWNEAAITWETRPDLAAVLGVVTLDGTSPRWVEVDVTKFVRREKKAGRNVVTFALRNVVHSSDYTVFNAKEAAQGRPELVLTPASP